MFGLSSMAVVRHWARVQRMWFVNSVVAPYLFCGCNVSGFIHWFWRYINRWLAYLTFPVTFFLTYFLYYLSTSLRINPFCFQAGCRKRWLNLTSFFCVHFVLSYIVLWVLVLLLLCLIQFFITKPEIGWEERLRNDLFVLDGTWVLISINHSLCLLCHPGLCELTVCVYLLLAGLVHSVSLLTGTKQLLTWHRRMSVGNLMPQWTFPVTSWKPEWPSCICLEVLVLKRTHRMQVSAVMETVLIGFILFF